MGTSAAAVRRAQEQYLTRYAEPECQAIVNLPLGRFQHCLIIPCYGEAADFAQRLAAGPLWRQDLLVIVVINQPPGPPDPLNRALFNHFQSWPKLASFQHLHLYGHPHQKSRWLIVDRFQGERTLPRSQGVGLARKIGCDLAVQLHHLGHLDNEWLHHTDADTHLPKNYFALPPTTGLSAAVYAFQHILTDTAATPQKQKVYTATRWYELALRYYIAGLEWAGSPYAWSTIGSALAVSAVAYCQARGMPKKSAGEDFYLLNKLRKLAPIYQARDITVAIEVRQSARVPFGTGPSVEAILALKRPAVDYRYYHPQTFVGLKAWLDLLPNLWPNRHRGLQLLESLPDPVAAGLVELKVGNLLAHLRTQITTGEAALGAIHDWFDAFRTLKLIHFLQAHEWPDQALAESIQHTDFATHLRTELACLTASERQLSTNSSTSPRIL